MHPAFRITAGSHDITAAVKDRLLELRVSDEAGITSDELRLTLDDRRTENGGIAQLPRVGITLAVSLGYDETGLTPMGSYLVDEMELSSPPATLTISAKAADMSGPFRARRSRSWDRVTLGEVVSVIAAEHGYTPKVDPQLAAFPIPHLDQVNESDMALLTRLAEERDAVAKPVAGHLVLARAGEAKSAGGRRLPLITLDPERLTGWRYRHSSRSPGGTGKSEGAAKPGGYRATWWDYRSGRTREVTVGSPPYEDIPYRRATEAEAREAALSRLNKGRRREGGLSLTLPGDPQLAAECRLHLVLRPGLPTDWRITKAEHTYSNNGYTTTVQAEKFVQGHANTL